MGVSITTPIAEAADCNPEIGWLDLPRRPFGSEAIGLRIGSLRFRMEGLRSSQSEALRGLYAPFLDEDAGPGRADLAIRIGDAGVERFLALPRGRAENYRLETRRRAGAEDFWSYEFAGTLRLGRAQADLALVSGEGALFHRGLENFLRIMTATYILDRGGLLLHAAAIVRHGRAHVFFGPSGAGKTTVTSLSPDDLALSDDLTLVVRHGASGFRAAGIPFGMAHHVVPATRDEFPIAGLYRLVQSQEVRRDALSGAGGLAEIGACLPFVMQDPTHAGIALATAASLLDAVPAWRLSFRKDGSFWRCIEGER